MEHRIDSVRILCEHLPNGKFQMTAYIGGDEKFVTTPAYVSFWSALQHLSMLTSAKVNIGLTQFDFTVDHVRVKEGEYVMVDDGEVPFTVDVLNFVDPNPGPF